MEGGTRRATGYKMCVSPTVGPGNESRHNVPRPWYGGCSLVVAVHETERAEVPRLCSLPVGRNISAVLSSSDISWEIAPREGKSWCLGQRTRHQQIRILCLSLLDSLSDENCHKAKAFSRAAEVVVLVLPLQGWLLPHNKGSSTDCEGQTGLGNLTSFEETLMVEYLEWKNDKILYLALMYIKVHVLIYVFNVFKSYLSSAPDCCCLLLAPALLPKAMVTPLASVGNSTSFSSIVSSMCNRQGTVHSASNDGWGTDFPPNGYTALGLLSRAVPMV